MHDSEVALLYILQEITREEQKDVLNIVSGAAGPTSAHQNRAILCGYGSDVYCSPQKTHDF